MHTILREKYAFTIEEQQSYRKLNFLIQKMPITGYTSLIYLKGNLS